MGAAANAARRYLSLAVLFTLLLSAGLVRLAAVDEMEGDMCADEMMWMVGWCLDGIGGDEPVTDAAALTSAEYVGSFESINVAGASATRAFGINAHGDIVGSYTDATGTHGFLRSRGVDTTINYPDAPGHRTTFTEAWGINPQGDIIGRYAAAGIPGTRGFLLSHETYTDISALGHLITLPTKIGASGEIVGCFHDINSVTDMYGYVQRGSSATTFTLPSIPVPAGSAAMHNGITPGGEIIVGLTFTTLTTQRGYIVNQGVVSFVDFPGSNTTQLWDVNPAGISVGQYTLNGRTDGLVVDADGLETIRVPGSTMTVARGINPRGDVVGVYNDSLGTHGFILRK
jgi:uncharacterized membrane protein